MGELRGRSVTSAPITVIQRGSLRYVGLELIRLLVA